MKSMTIFGDLTGDEFAEVIALLRRFDTADPTRTISIAISDDNASLNEAERVMQRAFTAIPARQTRIIKLPFPAA